MARCDRDKSLCPRPCVEVKDRVGSGLVYTEEHVGCRPPHTACSSVPVMEQYLLQEHTVSALITINATVSYFPCLYCHREVLKSADMTLKSGSGWHVSGQFPGSSMNSMLIVSGYDFSLFSS